MDRQKQNSPLELSRPSTTVHLRRMNRIVLTGGPGSGKTVISRAIAALEPNRFIAIPEAATQVYSNANTRWDLVNTVGQRELQRQIYFLQRKQEDAFAAGHPDKVQILDRGTIDGAAYWPDAPDAYWADLGTSLPAELARYDHVIWMQTSAAIGLYDGDDSNACRFEDAAGAVASGELLVKLWSGHPHFLKIAAQASLDDKIAEVRKVLDKIAPVESRRTS
jgi:predicted ATPase